MKKTCVLLCCLFLLGASPVAANLVDIELVRHGYCSDEEVKVDIVVTADGRLPQFVGAVDVLLSWQPQELEFLSIDITDAGANWLVADFLLDPDGVNDDISDGEVLLTFLSQPGEPAVAQTNCGTVLATLTFKRNVRGARIDIKDAVGEYADTQVYKYYEPNVEILGKTSGLLVDCSRRSIYGSNSRKTGN